MSGVLRIGVLGAAKISTKAMLGPALDTEGVEVVAIASRDRHRAAAQADTYGVPAVHDSYADLIADETVDAVYNPLPINLHHQWTLSAVAAGKHVLCEKPFASNTVEAREMVAAAQAQGRVLMEAFHWRYHPLAGRITEIVRGGLLGSIRTIDAVFNAPIPATQDVRHSWELSGGTLMDLGCYPVHWARFVAGGEPQVVSASMTEGRTLVDIDTRIDLRFAATTDRPGIAATLRTAMTPGVPFVARLDVRGDDGTLTVHNPLAPHVQHEIVVSTSAGQTSEHVEGRTTYHHQLEAFRAAVVDGISVPTGGDDAIGTMKVIDASYLAAGLPVRGT